MYNKSMTLKNQAYLTAFLYSLRHRIYISQQFVHLPLPLILILAYTAL